VRPAPNRSYREVLRDRHVAGLLLGDLLANVGTGMIIVAMPVQTLSLHGGVPKAIAIGLVEAAPFVLSTVLAVGSYVAFIWALKLQIQVWPTFITG